MIGSALCVIDWNMIYNTRAFYKEPKNCCLELVGCMGARDQGHPRLVFVQYVILCVQEQQHRQSIGRCTRFIARQRHAPGQ